MGSWVRLGWGNRREVKGNTVEAGSAGVMVNVMCQLG